MTKPLSLKLQFGLIDLCVVIPSRDGVCLSLGQVWYLQLT